MVRCEPRQFLFHRLRGTGAASCVRYLAVLSGRAAHSTIQLAHFTAEAEKVYYYRTRLIMTRSGVVRAVRA